MVDDAVSATLGDVCGTVGPRLLTVLVAPRGLEIPVAGVYLQDPREEISSDHAAGRVLLAVGTSTADDQLTPVMHAAAAVGAVAVVCRDGGRPSQSTLETAEAIGVALLSVPTDLSWGELYEVISAAVTVDDLESTVRAVDAQWRELNDLPAIVEALATITGGSVVIEDVHTRVLAYSEAEHADRMRTSAILSHHLPEEWQRQLRDRGIYEQLMKSDEVIHIEFEDLDLLPRRVVPVRLGRTTLGSIWLAGEVETLAPEADEALRRAAPIAALQMMRQRLAIGVERRMRESAAAALLRGEEASARTLGQIGLAVDENLVVLAVAVLSRGASSPAAVAPRLIDLLTMHLRTYERPAIGTALDESLVADAGQAPPVAARLEEEQVYILTRSRGVEDRDLLGQILEKALEHATRALGIRLRAGIGHEVGVAGDILAARRSAEDCLRLGPREAPVVRFEEVHDQALLADVNQLVHGWRGGPSDAFRAVVDHDAAHATDYLATLACLFDAFGSAPEVGRRMHLHVNTARYRIRRIGEITGVDFADGEKRLALELTLRANLPQDEVAPALRHQGESSCEDLTEP